MKLLDFSMPPSARIQFSSVEAKNVWEEKIKKASKAYHTLEKETVKKGIRRATTAHISHSDLPFALQRFAEEGLIYVPIRKVGAYSGFAHSHPEVVEGRPWNWFGVVASNPSDAHIWRTSHDSGDHETMGELLGYPKCCRDFFNTVWKSGYVDPIWQQAQGCKPEIKKNEKEKFIRLSKETPWVSSSMLRYIGVRITPHIPCSHDCKETQEIAEGWLNLGEDLKLEGIEELKQLLQMPIEWNASHGIAVIKTPICRIETNSVPCDSPHIVQREGIFFPKEGARGLAFPYL